MCGRLKEKAANGINGEVLSLASIIFIYIPIVIFLFGFVKWYWALPTVLFIACGFVKFKTHMSKDNTESKDVERRYITWKMVVLCLAICLFFGIICGWGGGGVTGK